MRTGHISGRGHGPGGRLIPMRGDLVEMLQKNDSWRLAEVLDYSGPGTRPGTPPSFRVTCGCGMSHGHTQADDTGSWRWPHKKPGSESCCTNCDLAVEAVTDSKREGLTCFLYVLMRDELPTGVIERIVRDHVERNSVVGAGVSLGRYVYSNKPLEAYARELAAKIVP